MCERMRGGMLNKMHVRVGGRGMGVWVHESAGVCDLWYRYEYLKILVVGVWVYARVFMGDRCTRGCACMCILQR